MHGVIPSMSVMSESTVNTEDVRFSVAAGMSDCLSLPCCQLILSLNAVSTNPFFPRREFLALPLCLPPTMLSYHISANDSNPEKMPSNSR